MLYWTFSTGDAFSCILKIELQSTRVYMHKEEVSERMNYLVGVSIWWTWGRLDNFLDDSSCNHLPLLGWNSGGNICRSLSSFGSRLKQVWLNSHYHFLHWWRSLAEKHIRGSWKKVEWLPIAGHGFGIILLLQTGWTELAKRKDRGLRKNKCTDSVPLLRGLHIQGQFAADEDLKLSWIHVFSHSPPCAKADWWRDKGQIGWYWNVEVVEHAIASWAGETIGQIGSVLHQVVNMEVGRDLS